MKTILLLVTIIIFYGLVGHYEYEDLQNEPSQNEPSQNEPSQWSVEK